MKKVLLIDDDHAILDALSLVLTEVGFIVQTLDSGKEVVQTMLSFKPDIVFMDIWMSGKDGVHIAKEIKEEKALHMIPIVIISALSDAKKLTNSAFVDDFLPKPFAMEDIAKIIAKHCGK